MLNRRICFKIIPLLQIFNTSARNYLAVKSSKKRFKHAESVARILKIKKCTSFAQANLALLCIKLFGFQVFLARFALLSIHGFCRCKVPVQFNGELFTSGPIGVYYLALKIFKWELNKLSNTRFGINWHLIYHATKFALKLTIVRFPNVIRIMAGKWQLSLE